MDGMGCYIPTLYIYIMQDARETDTDGALRSIDRTLETNNGTAWGVTTCRGKEQHSCHEAHTHTPSEDIKNHRQCTPRHVGVTLSLRDATSVTSRLVASRHVTQVLRLILSCQRAAHPAPRGSVCGESCPLTAGGDGGDDGRRAELA